MLIDLYRQYLSHCLIFYLEKTFLSNAMDKGVFLEKLENFEPSFFILKID